jgi:hypothetical protein
MPVEGAATAEGLLERTPFAHLLVYAVDKRLTGAMVFNEPGGAEHVVQLARGVVVKVRPGDQFAMFGEILVEDGLVSRETLDAALATRGLIGDVLLLSGCIDAGTLEWVAEVQFVRRMVRLFALPAGTRYQYFEGLRLLDEWGGEPARVDPLALLWAGLRDHGGRSTRIGPTLARLKDMPLRVHPALDPGRFGFRGAELSAVGRLRESAPSLAGLIETGVAPEEALRSLVYALVITRYIDVHGTGVAPVGLTSSARSQAQGNSQALGRMQLRTTMHRLGAAAPDPAGDGERSSTSTSRGRGKDRISQTPGDTRESSEPASTELWGGGPGEAPPPSSALRPVGPPSSAMSGAREPPSSATSGVKGPPSGEPRSEPGEGLASPLSKR